MKTHRKAASLLFPLLLILVCAVPEAEAAQGDQMKQHTFQTAMRKLWEDHVTWTRLYIVSALADLPDRGPTAERLLRNQVDIGNAIKPFYGDPAGEKLTALLNDHIVIAVDVVSAAKAGDQAKLKEANKRWYANADDIGAFLGGANPKNWPSAEMKSMMREHLDLINAMVVARLNKDWAGDIATYDKYHEHILKMVADVLSEGTIRQFPDKL
ncbi:hypothetical protein [Methyloglobulus sp.]|uniref:hypothetical protein n=1 Tax=Methyloglobulus sp. TaxID=2518622 RepID=UPI0039896C43